MLTRPQPRVLVQRLPGREGAERKGGGREMIHGNGFGGKVGGGAVT